MNLTEPGTLFAACSFVYQIGVECVWSGKRLLEGSQASGGPIVCRECGTSVFGRRRDRQVACDGQFFE